MIQYQTLFINLHRLHYSINHPIILISSHTNLNFLHDFAHLSQTCMYVNKKINRPTKSSMIHVTKSHSDPKKICHIFVSVCMNQYSHWWFYQFDKTLYFDFGVDILFTNFKCISLVWQVHQSKITQISVSLT